MNTVTISSRIISSFLDEISSCHGNVDFDIEIIQCLVDGWVNAGDKDAIAELKQKLLEIVNSIPEG